MLLIEQLYLLASTLFLAGKDALSYKLMDKGTHYLKMKRLRRWHRDGAVLSILFTLPLVYYTQVYWLILLSLLIRLSVFNLAFNKWAGLDPHHIGSTAITDRVFSKIFGKKGAVKQSLFFLLLLILINIYIHK